MKKALFVALALLALGCTEQQRAKSFGGSMTVDLPAAQKLVVATWKNSDLWYLTRPMRTGEQVEVYDFRESSSFGVIQGTVHFVEKE